MSSGHFARISEEDFLKDAMALVEGAQKKGIYIRFLGAFAVYVHSLDNPAAVEAFRLLGRLGKENPMFTDLDLVMYSKQRGDATKLLEQMGFRPDNTANMMFGGRRMIYYEPQGRYSVDLFIDKLEYSHNVEFGKKPGSGRLELDFPTITLADIVLEKLQIHQINRKDVVDLVVLFLGHDVGDGAQANSVDGGYISRLLSNDWGFWYDATRNLASVEAFAKEAATQNSTLTNDQAALVTGRVGRLRSMIDSFPKTKDWEKRARTGTSKPWYQDVGEIAR